MAYLRLYQNDIIHSNNLCKFYSVFKLFIIMRYQCTVLKTNY